MQRLFSSMSIRGKLTTGFLAVAALVVIVGLIAIVQQQRIAEMAAITEAENVARLIEESITPELLPSVRRGDRGLFGDPVRLQTYVNNLHDFQGRDIAIVDANKVMIAEADTEEIGEVLAFDPHNEVGLTLQDGQTRSFFEVSDINPEGIRNVVIPIDNQDGQIVGAIVFEYTPLYEQMLAIVRRTSLYMLIAGGTCLLLALGIGYASAATISGPIRKLNLAARALADGQWDAPIDVQSEDELGQLAQTFKQMAKAIQEREAGLRAATEEAREANRLKDMFLATMSHELRTPLNSILTFNQLLGMGTFGPVNDEQKEYLDKALSSGRHLLALINDVLDITKIQSGMMKLFVENDFDVTTEALEVAATTEKILADKPVRLITDIDRNLPPLVCDKRRVRQIMLNLVSNAVKFTEHGSVTLQAKKQGENILFAVIDTGPGIRPEDQDIIFNPFVQTDTGIKHGGGTGLGLPITRSLVSAHGGQLRLESRPGAGAAFYVTLPLQPTLVPGEQEI